jgi:hypothetical protein
LCDYEVSACLGRRLGAAQTLNSSVAILELIAVGLKIRVPVREIDNFNGSVQQRLRQSFELFAACRVRDDQRQVRTGDRLEEAHAGNAWFDRRRRSRISAGKSCLTPIILDGAQPSTRDNEMVEQIEIELRGQCAQVPGYCYIGVTWLGDTGRVIVDENEASRTDCQSATDDGPTINRSSLETAFRDPLNSH